MKPQIEWLEEDREDASWCGWLFRAVVSRAWVGQRKNVAYYWTIVDNAVRRAPDIEIAKCSAMALVHSNLYVVATAAADIKRTAALAEEWRMRGCVSSRTGT